jgi:hypothetical protein
LAAPGEAGDTNHVIPGGGVQLDPFDRLRVREPSGRAGPDVRGRRVCSAADKEEDEPEQQPDQRDMIQDEMHLHGGQFDLLMSRTSIAKVGPTDLLAQYVASTFVLVLNWWVEGRSPLPPKDINDLFRALILPTLAATTG